MIGVIGTAQFPISPSKNYFEVIPQGNLVPRVQYKIKIGIHTDDKRLKDIDIYEYRKQFDAISIEKVINHNDFMALLCETGENTATLE